jgi:predicted RNase H-like nuclease
MLVIVGSECPPGTFCVFNAGWVVVVIPGGAETTAPWRAFVGRPHQAVFELVYPDLPRHMLALLPVDARPSQPGP